MSLIIGHLAIGGLSISGPSSSSASGIFLFLSGDRFGIRYFVFLGWCRNSATFLSLILFFDLLFFGLFSNQFRRLCSFLLLGLLFVLDVEMALARYWVVEILLYGTIRPLSNQLRYDFVFHWLLYIIGFHFVLRWDFVSILVQLGLHGDKLHSVRLRQVDFLDFEANSLVKLDGLGAGTYIERQGVFGVRHEQIIDHFFADALTLIFNPHRNSVQITALDPLLAEAGVAHVVN